MASWLLPIGIIAFLGGCSTLHDVKPRTVLPPPEQNTTSNIIFPVNVDDQNTCCPLPQELETKLPVLPPRISDLQFYPQNAEIYALHNVKNHETLTDKQQAFEQYYYSPWRYEAPPISVFEASWPLRAFKGGYGSNLRPVTSDWHVHMSEQSAFDSFGTLNQKAITLKRLDIRALPTDKPLYNNPELPGEGFPFDMLQNSSVHFSEPVFISHRSKDGGWSYIFTNNASGWVKSDALAILSNDDVKKMMNLPKLYLTHDNIPLYTHKGEFMDYSRIGMVFSVARDNNDSYYVLAGSKESNLSEIEFPKGYGHIGPSAINAEELALIGNQMLRNTYGWGGMFGERDCSAMIRDMYTPFGLWLPRNSGSQAKKGEVISFKGMSNEQKIALIKEKAIPFETILYKKGHVLLYLGIYQDTVMAMHNIWAIRTIDKEGRKGRHIVGKAVISTLEFGSDIENFDPDQKLLSTLESMNIFTLSAPVLSQTKKPKKKIKL